MEITVTKKKYERTASGKSWKAQPYETTTERLTEEQFKKCTSDDTCAFCRRQGGSVTVTRSYTALGYVPVRISSIFPDRETKMVRIFNIQG